jgi:hypothetical protein
MIKKAIFATAFLLILAVTLCALNDPGNFVLVESNTAIQRLGAKQPFMSVAMLPDTIPPYFPHPKDMKLRNERFHLLTQAPEQDLLAFSAGEVNQWIGFMNLKDRFMKFLSWGVQTRYLDLTFSSDGEYLAYAFHGPDRRILTAIIPTPTRETKKPEVTNVWFKTYRNNEQFQPLGWVLPGDTTYSFAILDSLGTRLERVDLPLHLNWDDVPENMKKTRKKAKPSGTVPEE